MHVYGADLFYPVSNFWKELKRNPLQLLEAVSLLRPLSKAEFYRLRETILTQTDTTLQAAFFFAINRSSFNGSTFSGGYSQESSEKRFTESSLERLRMTNMQNISMSTLDFEEFLRRHTPSPEKVVFLDPPYCIKNYLYGRDGDMHLDFDHKRLSSILHKRNDWMLCYNDCDLIRELYSDCSIHTVNWSYGMNTSKKSNEILILPKKGGT
jgi:DNA adenine methylase